MRTNADRELLELAAKAAGIQVSGWSIDQSKGMRMESWPDGEFLRFWSPLEDDGDALRLAVKLGMTISLSNHIHATEVWGFDEFWHTICNTHEDDPYAATRRAIVRAAAKIGEESYEEASN